MPRTAGTDSPTDADDHSIERDLVHALRWASCQMDIFNRRSDNGWYVDCRHDFARRAFVWSYLRFHPDRPRSLCAIQTATRSHSLSAIRDATENLRELFARRPSVCLWHHVPMEYMLSYVNARRWRPYPPGAIPARKPGQPDGEPGPRAS